MAFNCIWYIIRSNDNPFFLDPQLDKRSRKTKHQEEIFEIYKNWLESPFINEIDLNDFDLNKLKIVFKKSFPSRIIDQKDKPQSVEEQALYHLYQENVEAFELYEQILEKKNEFNKKMGIFIEDIKKNLKDLLKSKGYEKHEDIIDSPLRFYLVKMNNCLNKKKDYVNSILEYDRAYLKNGSIENRTWEIKDELVVLMKSNWPKSVETIKIFKKDSQDLNDLIPQFQKSIKLTTSHKHMKLKSSCIIENELSIKSKVISFICRKK